MPEFCQGFASPTVDLWLLSTEAVEPKLQHVLKACLSPAEQVQLQHTHRPAAQRQFLLSRGCLRYLLSRYTGQSPAALTFVYGPKGKPELSPDTSNSEWPRFNLSHSGQRLLVAISTAEDVRAIGVDVETLRSLKRLAGLCRRCLTAAEAETVLNLPNPKADYQFLRYWTGKEACLKALGLGISDSMQALELALEAPHLTSAPALVTVAARGIEHPGWLYQWQLEPGYLVAIAIQAAFPAPGLRLWPTTPAAVLSGG